MMSFTVLGEKIDRFICDIFGHDKQSMNWKDGRGNSGVTWRCRRCGIVNTPPVNEYGFYQIYKESIQKEPPTLDQVLDAQRKHDPSRLIDE